MFGETKNGTQIQGIPEGRVSAQQGKAWWGRREGPESRCCRKHRPGTRAQGYSGKQKIASVKCLMATRVRIRVRG